MLLKHTLRIVKVPLLHAFLYGIGDNIAYEHKQRQYKPRKIPYYHWRHIYYPRKAVFIPKQGREKHCAEQRCQYEFRRKQALYAARIGDGLNVRLFLIGKIYHRKHGYVYYIRKIIAYAADKRIGSAYKHIARPQRKRRHARDKARHKVRADMLHKPFQVHFALITFKLQYMHQRNGRRHNGRPHEYAERITQNAANKLVSHR